MPFVLDLYLDRIGWSGPQEATYATLAALQRRHMIAIPFENLDVLLGCPIELDLDSIQRKLVTARRGGYCFEHTTLFAAVLEALGFQLRRQIARVILRSAPEEAALTHMFLTVTLPEGDYVVDPGFGGPGSLLPLPLTNQQPNDPTITHWMIQDGLNWIMRTNRDGTSHDAWISTLQPAYPVDYVMANHFTATHSSSPFVNFIMMSRFTEDGSITIMNRDVTITHADQSEKSRLSDRRTLRQLLQEWFGFDLPEVEQLRVPTIREWQ